MSAAAFYCKQQAIYLLACRQKNRFNLMFISLSCIATTTYINLITRAKSTLTFRRLFFLFFSFHFLLSAADSKVLSAARLQKPSGNLACFTFIYLFFYLSVCGSGSYVPHRFHRSAVGILQGQQLSFCDDG